MSIETVSGPGKGDHEKLVHVEVDKRRHELPGGEYLVSDFKAKVGVPAEKVLEMKIRGKFEPLDDSATIVIKNGEVFVSHVRRGGSS